MDKINKNKTNCPMDYLNKIQLSQLLNCSVKSVVNWTLSNRLPIVRIGRLVRYPRTEIEKRLLSGQLLTTKEYKEVK